MPILVGNYSETISFRDEIDDLWNLFYDNWYLKGCPARGNDTKPGDTITLNQEEIELVNKHSKRIKPGIILKGEKHVRKFLYGLRSGAIIWRGNLDIYKIAEKYSVLPPDERDFSENTNMPTHVYNQSPI